MAKCCGNTCSCVLQGAVDKDGHHATLITGSGTNQDPYEISFKGIAFTSANGDIAVAATFDTTNGYSFSLDLGPNSRLDHLGNVNVPAPNDGDVLYFDGTSGQWISHSVPTAAAGSLVTGSNALAGEGTDVSPLQVVTDPDGDIEVGAAGLKLTAAALAQVVTHYADSTARDTATTAAAPELNALSMLDTVPGQIDFWDGTEWYPMLAIDSVTGAEFLALSGSYDTTNPVSILVKQLAGTTDTNGAITLLDATDLDGFAGVLSITVQPVLEATYTTGSVAWTMAVNPAASTTEVIGVAFATDGTGEWLSQPITAIVTAYLY